jgi:hypothetical protein
MAATVETAPRSRWARLWPWAVLMLATLPAIWHVLSFPDDIDGEFPDVVRPTFCPRPPPAYRLAEPGDTIDRVALYAAAGAIVFSAMSLALRKRAGQPLHLWPAALGLAVLAFWHQATPGPLYDGWYGWNWRAIANPGAPPALRIGLATVFLGLSAIVIASLVANRKRWPVLWQRARVRACLNLFLAAAVLAVLRQVEIPGVEPRGYWPRWAFVWSMLAFDLGLLRAWPASASPRGRWAALAVVVGAAAWAALIHVGLDIVWTQRPLLRLRAIVPGKIYMSAMPTYRGLELAHARHHFKTIIDLFPEDTPQRSPRLPEELRFAREHGIHFLRSPAGVLESDAFLDRTLALAQDPSAWPILVHCHGCVDRTPAWMGIYRFVVEGRPLLDIMREIEQHRGYRPKASVILLYNRVLSPRAPEHYAHDPTAQLLRACAQASIDPYYEQFRQEAQNTNLTTPSRVSRSASPDRQSEARPAVR